MADTFPNEARVNQLNLIAGAGGSNLFVHLARNNPPINESTRLIDFLEANFDGYAAYNSNQWSPPAVDVNGDVFILSPIIVWQKAVGTTFNTIYAHYITVGALPGGLLLQCGVEPTPYYMSVPSDQVPLRLRVGLRSLAA